MPSIEEQIATLERRLRRQQLATGIAVALAVVAIGVAVASRTAGELRARAFQLVNSDGTMVAQLGLTPRGGPFLKLHVPDNGGSVMLGSLGEDLAGVAVASGDEALVFISTDKNGNPSMSLNDKGRKALLSVRGDHPPTLLMLGSPGLLRASSEHVWLKDPSGKTVFSTAPGGAPPDEKAE
jgi:hypothetical protein